ncbi:MAG TPA: thiamine pyrophosphate-dependent enzyme, partial [Acidimicrobiales bacterium]|nr:thiamine pyrophosphate-dependent enzyme [Acidimicrobiales bacterium]
AEAASTWRTLAARLYGAACGHRGEPGPVHLNAAFVEPLVAAPGELPAARGEPDGPTSEVVPATGLEVAGRAVLCVVGLGVSAETVDRARAADWAVVGDATVASTLAHADVVLRDDALAAWLEPEVVVRLGGAPASKALAARLASWGGPVVALDGAGPVADPDGVVTRRLAGRPDPTDPAHRGDPRYVARWAAVSDAVESYLAERHDDVLDEPGVARVVVAAANDAGVDLVVGSSMPVRDVEWWAPTRRVRVFANRGANGIDGVVSTALGVAAGSRAVALVGDLTFLHDVSGLVSGLGSAGGSLVLVVADNRGGGIFSFLAQRALLAPERFETLFGTPHDHDLVAVARAFGARATRVGDGAALAAEIAAGLAAGGLHVVVATVPDRDENVERHARLIESACRAAGALR